jgi:hypothetical protein
MDGHQRDRTKSRLDDYHLLPDIGACPAWVCLRGIALLNL